MKSLLVISSDQTALEQYAVGAKKKYNPADVFRLCNRGTGPDTEPQTITVKDVSDFMAHAHLAPVGKEKIMIISDMSSVTPQAQNKMLKTLEDLPGHTNFLLLATNPDVVLNTIKSRCMTKYLPLPKTDGKIIPDDIAMTMEKIFGIKIDEKVLNERQRYDILKTIGEINRAVRYNCNETNRRDLLIMELIKICKQ